MAEGASLGAPATNRRGARRPASRPQGRARAARRPAQITVPVDIGVGPAFFMFANPNVEKLGFEGQLAEDQQWHYGLTLSLAAIIDREFVRENAGIVPREARSFVERSGEVRYAPGVVSLIPRAIFLSPRVENTAIFGATWQVLGLGLVFLPSPVRLSVNGGVLATYAYIDSTTLGTTHFLRPGADANVDLEIPLGKSFALSTGWGSQFYIPQRIGGSIAESGEGRESIWHVGRTYLKLHFRVPFTTTL